MKPPRTVNTNDEFTQPQLYAYLLAVPHATFAGQPLTMARTQIRALFYRLITRPQRVTREELCFLFWPDADNGKARRNLTQLLSHLRRALPVPAVLIATKEDVQLDPAQVWSDAAHFEQLCAHANGQRLSALYQAVDLYRASFLDGVTLTDCPEFEEWVAGERRYFEQHYLNALATLVEDAASQHDYSKAIHLAQRYLQVDELAEDIHRQLIQYHAALGDLHAVRRQYEQCTLILDRELGVDPLPETQAAYRAALAGESAPATPTPAQPLGPTAAPDRLPLVGRDTELQRLQQAFRRAQTGETQVTLVVGEAGIGKSRLLQTFVAQVQSQALVLTGAGYPGEQSIPYQPLIDALRPALATIAAARTIAPTWLAEAALLLPELYSLRPELAHVTPDGSESARGRLFAALCHLLLGLTNGGACTVLLCLDDLHWADATTIDWLCYLAQHAAGHRLLVLGSYQCAEAAPLAELRHLLDRRRLLCEIVLTPLPAAAVGAMAHQQLGYAIAADLTTHLYQTTGGNPLFVSETLKLLTEQTPAPIILADLQALPLRATMQATVQRRLAQLAPATRQILEAAAVLRRNFDFNLLWHTAGRPELETSDALDELVARGLLEAQEENFAFHHELVAAVVYQQLSHWRRRLLHRRAAVVLESQAVGRRLASDSQQTAHLATLVHHFTQAYETEKAAAYRLLAGDQSRLLSTHAEFISTPDEAAVRYTAQQVDVIPLEGLPPARKAQMGQQHASEPICHSLSQHALCRLCDKPAALC
ncbi:MAG: AAA family ATPase [Caldilineaceae bacterium]